MKKKLPVLGLLLFLSLTLTACTLQDLPLIGKLFGKKTSNEPVTLTMWGLWESPAVMQKIIDKYQKLRPNVTVKYDDRSVLKPDDYRDRIYGSAGQTIDADVISVHNSWVAKLKDTLTPLPSTIMDVKTYSSSFYPVVSESALLNGKVYAMPYYYDGLALVYNKKHFADVGQTDAPTAWEEFRRLAIQLTVRGGDGKIVRAGVAIGTADNIDFFSDVLGLMWSQAGVAIPGDLTSKPAQDALTFYTNFVKEDKVWDATLPEAATAFANGQVSMIFAPSWLVSDILTARPDLEIGVAPVPQAVPSNPASWGSFWMEAVPNTSKHADAAWDFISFLSKEEQQLMLSNENSAIRKLASPFSLVSLASQDASNPYLKPYLDTAAFAKSSVISARSGNKTQTDLLRTAVNSVLSGTSASDALKTMVSGGK